MHLQTDIHSADLLKGRAIFPTAYRKESLEYTHVARPTRTLPRSLPAECARTGKLQMKLKKAVPKNENGLFDLTPSKP